MPISNILDFERGLKNMYKVQCIIVHVWMYIELRNGPNLQNHIW